MQLNLMKYTNLAKSHMFLFLLKSPSLLVSRISFQYQLHLLITLTSYLRANSGMIKRNILKWNILDSQQQDMQLLSRDKYEKNKFVPGTYPTFLLLITIVSWETEFETAYLLAETIARCNRCSLNTFKPSYRIANTNMATHAPTIPAEIQEITKFLKQYKHSVYMTLELEKNFVFTAADIYGY